MVSGEGFKVLSECFAEVHRAVHITFVAQQAKLSCRDFIVIADGAMLNTFFINSKKHFVSPSVSLPTCLVRGEARRRSIDQYDSRPPKSARPVERHGN